MDICARIDVREWAIWFNKHIDDHFFHTHLCIAENLKDQSSLNDLSSLLASQLANRGRLDNTKYWYKICASGRFRNLLSKGEHHFDAPSQDSYIQPAPKLCNYGIIYIKCCPEFYRFGHCHERHAEEPLDVWRAEPVRRDDGCIWPA